MGLKSYRFWQEGRGEGGGGSECLPFPPKCSPVAVLKIKLTCETIHFVVVVVQIQIHSNQSLCMEFNKKSHPKTDYC